MINMQTEPKWWVGWAERGYQCGVWEYPDGSEVWVVVRPNGSEVTLGEISRAHEEFSFDGTFLDMKDAVNILINDDAALGQ